MIEKVIIAGSGGQGIELSGELLAEALMYQGHNVTFFPSYGAQVRGGHAYCHVVASTEEIRSPVVERPNTLIALNQPAYDKYGPAVEESGCVIANSSMLKRRSGSSVRTVAIPATEKAIELGNMLVANMIMMGAYHAVRGLLAKGPFFKALALHLTGKKAVLLDIDKRAFELGIELARGSA